MNANVTDEQITRMLRERASDPPPAALERLLLSVDATAQVGTWRAGLRLSAATRAILVAVLLLGLAAGGLALLGSRPEAPDPPSVVSNGVVAVSDGCGLVAIDVSTGSEEALVPEFEDGCPDFLITYEVDWSADGEVLAYSSSFFCGGCYSSQAKAAIRDSGIWVVNTGTGTRSQFQPGCEGSRTCPFETIALSPDGQHVAALRGGDYVLVNVNGGREVEIPTGRANTGSPSAGIAWSPDSERVAYILEGDTLYTANADGTAPTLLIPDSEQPIRDPSWSPDGQHISVAATNDSAIVVVAADGTGLRSIPTTGPPSGPRWSPDGHRIAFRISRPADGGIWVTDADGSSSQRLVPHPGPSASGPVWAPDGRYVLFAAAGMGTYVVDLDGSPPRLLAPLLSGNYFGHSPPTPAWQPVNGRDE